MKAWRGLAAVFVLILVLAALGWYWWTTQRPGPLRLRQSSFAALPGWQHDPARAALAAFERSCVLLKKLPPATAMSGAGYGGKVGDWLGPCADGAAAKDARLFFERDFVPYAVGAGGRREGLFTGYYEPRLQGSRTRHGAFRFAVYGAPSDLIRVDLGLFSPRFRGEHIAGKISGHRLVPYAPRAQIAKEGLPQAPVLFYTDDAVALFFLQIQGSGRVRFEDGSEQRVAYAGQNGQPYTAIGRVLMARGILTRHQVSLQSIQHWLRAHPAQAQSVMDADKSFVFFKLLPIADAFLGSVGTQGANLTPQASLAVDPRLHALGAPFFVAAKNVRGLYIAQDSGGAIRGPVRGDIFFGAGPEAAQDAGGLKARGRLFVLLPKALSARLGRVWSAP
jgi:membrane-bound lytic murein transglycosylase A